MAQLFRGMMENPHSLPYLGESARALGVRPGIDVPAVHDAELVHPGDGGLSVSPGDPLSLPPYRRPPELHGVGRDPVWVLDTRDLGPALAFRPDGRNPGHGFIEPTRPMSLAEFRQALESTQSRWRKLAAWPQSEGNANGP
jgi:hypothetical protein